VRRDLQPQSHGATELQRSTLSIQFERTVVLELKSVERFDPVFEAQLLTYLRIANLHVGLLINFNSRLLHEGIKRFVL
jgi:GxxExxY protein